MIVDQQQKPANKKVLYACTAGLSLTIQQYPYMRNQYLKTIYLNKLLAFAQLHQQHLLHFFKGNIFMLLFSLTIVRAQQTVIPKDFYWESIIWALGFLLRTFSKSTAPLPAARNDLEQVLRLVSTLD